MSVQVPTYTISNNCTVIHISVLFLLLYFVVKNENLLPYKRRIYDQQYLFWVGAASGVVGGDIVWVNKAEWITLTA